MRAPKTKVLITSSGTGSGVNAIRALRLDAPGRFEILATDADPSAPGLFLADRHYLLPKCGAPTFYAALSEIVKKEQSEIFCLPTFSGEIEWFARNAVLLEEQGIHTFLPPAEAVEICNDKWRFSLFADSVELRVPQTLFCSGLADQSEASLRELSYPVFAKQISGSGSRFATRVQSPEDLAFYLKTHQNLIVQECVEGEEVTVDVFCGSSGKPSAVCARKRVAVKSGQSVKGVTLDAAPFMHPISRVCAALQLRGASNFQFILSKNGVVLIEVNPRFAAGGLMLSVHAGVNLPLLCVEAMESKNEGPEIDVLNGRVGLCMSKFWNEVVYNL